MRITKAIATATILAALTACDDGEQASASASVIEQCKTAMLDNLSPPSKGDFSREIALAMIGRDDAGSTASKDSDGAWTVNMQRAAQHEQTCPARMVGSCTVKDGKVQITKMINQDGFIAC